MLRKELSILLTRQVKLTNKRSKKHKQTDWQNIKITLESAH